jgi:hypothetical protein
MRRKPHFFFLGINPDFAGAILKFSEAGRPLGVEWAVAVICHL